MPRAPDVPQPREASEAPGTSEAGGPRLDVFRCGLLFYDVVFTGLQQAPTPGAEVWSTGVGSGSGGIATFALALSRLGLRTGLTAAFYRQNLFAQAGLPTDPAKVGAAMDTWDGYFEVGQKIRKALPKSFLINNISSVFTLIIGQGTKRFIDENTHFIGDGDHIKAARDTAVKALTPGGRGRCGSGGSTWRSRRSM
jgi:hypothetical protein